jgi:hypothetical protein
LDPGPDARNSVAPDPRSVQQLCPALAAGWKADFVHLGAADLRPLQCVRGRQRCTEQAFLTTSNDKYAQAISPDGKTLIFSPTTPGTGQDLWSGPLEAIRDAKPFLATAFYECGASFSPDGRWIVYVSDESGKREVYVRDFPAGGTRFQASTNGGDEPVWARNGKEIFYLAGKKLMTVPVQTTPSFVPGTPATLFEAGFEASGLNTPSYDVSPDGQLFYLIQQDKPTQQQASVKLLLRWPEELKRLVRQQKRP